jgi:putative Mg2+ transporter-C (MgtC) family protein
MEMNVFLFRLELAFVLSLIFGLERQKSHKPVGFGTFIFVTLGACSLSIIALELGGTNPLPLLGAIVTGIGFLGAGALIKTTDKIFGFTTAASIWVFSILGLSMGVGNYKVGFALYFFVWVSIFVDKYLESKGIGSYQKKIVVKMKGMDQKNWVENIINKAKIKKGKLIFKRINKEMNYTELGYILDGTEAHLVAVLKTLESEPGFIEGTIE